MAWGQRGSGRGTRAGSALDMRDLISPREDSAWYARIACAPSFCSAPRAPGRASFCGPAVRPFARLVSACMHRVGMEHACARNNMLQQSDEPLA